MILSEILQLLGVLLVAATKFLYSSATAYLLGYTFLQTLIVTAVGGIIGFFVFYKFGKVIFSILGRLLPRKRKKSKFSNWTRRFIQIKNSYGLIGLAFVTPCIISIPVGGVIAAKYYPQTKRVMMFMSVSVLLWSLLLSAITFLLGPIFE